MDYSALNIEIVKSDYSNLSDDEIVSALNVKTITIQKDITIAQGLTWAAKAGILLTIKSLSENVGPLQNIAYATMVMFNSLDAKLELTSDNIKDLIGAYVMTSIITQEQSDNLFAQGQEIKHWGTSIGCDRPFEIADLIAARAS